MSQVSIPPVLDGPPPTQPWVSLGGNSAVATLEHRVSILTQQLSCADRELATSAAEFGRVTARFERLIDGLPGGVIVLDGQGMVCDSNPAAERLLGASPIGRPWRDVVTEAFRPRPDDGHDITLTSGYRVNLSTCSLGGEPGQIVLLADVTETRRLQDQAARLERIGALGRTVSGLAHQIRTPLGAALLHATNLPRGRARDRVVERLRALEDLVNDMLTYTRQGEFNVEVLDVDVLLNELACAQGDRTTKVMVGRSSTQRRALVRGNRTALASAMQNLIDNALEADPNATVSLSTSVAHAGEEICLRCTDDGPGIPGELRERIFEPFFSTRLDGTGLGLAIVRSIIDAHGGRIEFDRSSMCGPRGTTFLITLPAIADLDSVVHGNALCDA